ncbi:SGNH/GDSL hydrolase family protein [Histophilus somni]|uniref:Possible N-acylneuraminate cytidylyltransferase n=1 Tax=Histophilus somni (strain 129Pt) TaxID=205914 RepID=Q0I2T3_HISS1|nr:SGNH/GDSL hydrolase family protein [Histophilus somni]QEH17733.1 acylneuraminate cytidylyltransferase [Histophilus somni]THA22188.1 acylneuraminate cytidylyltransferase [Histophilus somni]
MLTDQDIFNRYQVKKAEFEKQADITLVGHSLFDMWSDISPEIQLRGKRVANLGISGVSARQYLDVIIKPQLINYLGKKVFIFLGVNDIVKEPEYSHAKVLDWICDIWQALVKISPESEFFLLEATPVNNIATTDNSSIMALNDYLRENCPERLTFIDTWQDFVGKDGKLDLTLCTDGLHFNRKGYEVLTRKLTQYL